MIEFNIKLETIPDADSAICLFKNLQDQKKSSDEKEYLMHLEAIYPFADEVKKQEAEFILVADRSSSMEGNPWSQVQSALLQMLDLTKKQKIKCHAIEYNHKASFIKFLNVPLANSMLIKKLQANGSTNFVAAFNQLNKFFKEDAKKSSKSYFVLFLTDGNDTCNNPEAIMTAKEHLQDEIEKLGCEVIFNVLGFSNDHDEQFLESLTYLGTSDGTYNFVNEREGNKALEERLVQLLTSTASVIGKSVNIQVEGENVKFLGEWFGNKDTDVVLPAMIVKKDNTTKVMTKKFVLMENDQDPQLKIRVYQKLSEGAEAKEASVKSVDRIILESEKEIGNYNLKKLRNSLNMITDKISQEDREDEELRGWCEIAESYIKGNKDKLQKDEENAKAIQTVEQGLSLCKNVLCPTDPLQDEREQDLRRMEMASKYSMSSCMPQNQMKMKKRSTGNKWVKEGAESKRTQLQQKTRATDFTMADMADEIN